MRDLLLVATIVGILLGGARAWTVALVQPADPEEDACTCDESVLLQQEQPSVTEEGESVDSTPPSTQAEEQTIVRTGGPDGADHSFTTIQDLNPADIDAGLACQCKRGHGRKPRHTVICNKPLKPHLHNYDPECFKAKSPNCTVDAPEEQRVVFKMALSLPTSTAVDALQRAGGSAKLQTSTESGATDSEDPVVTHIPGHPPRGAGGHPTAKDAVSPPKNQPSVDGSAPEPIDIASVGEAGNPAEFEWGKGSPNRALVVKSMSEALGVPEDGLELAEVTFDPLIIVTKMTLEEGADASVMVGNIMNTVDSGVLASVMKNVGLDVEPQLMAIEVPAGANVPKMEDRRNGKEKTSFALRVPALGRPPIEGVGGGFVEDGTEEPVTSAEDLAAMGAAPVSANGDRAEMHRQLYRAELKAIRARLRAIDAEEIELGEELSSLRQQLLQPPAFMVPEQAEEAEGAPKMSLMASGAGPSEELQVSQEVSHVHHHTFPSVPVGDEVDPA